LARRGVVGSARKQRAVGLDIHYRFNPDIWIFGFLDIFKKGEDDRYILETVR